MEALKPEWKSKALVSDTKAFFVKGLPEDYMNNGPEEVVLVNRYFFMAEMGQRGTPDFPAVMVWPVRNGSVVEVLICTVMKSGLLS